MIETLTPYLHRLFTNIYRTDYWNSNTCVSRRRRRKPIGLAMRVAANLRLLAGKLRLRAANLRPRAGKLRLLVGILHLLAGNLRLPTCSFQRNNISRSRSGNRWRRRRWPRSSVALPKPNIALPAKIALSTRLIVTEITLLPTTSPQAAPRLSIHQGCVFIPVRSG